MRYLLPVIMLLLNACASPQVAQGQCLPDKFATDQYGNVVYPCGHEPKVAMIEPIIDTKGIDETSLAADLEECNAYARRINPGANMLASAAAGAAAGAAVGAIVGDEFNTDTTGYGAKLGGLSGGIQGGASGVATREQVVKRCMAGRGYSVLN